MTFYGFSHKAIVLNLHFYLSKMLQCIGMNIPLILQARVLNESDLRENFSADFSLSSIPEELLCQLNMQHDSWNGFESEKSYWDTLLESYCFNPTYLNGMEVYTSQNEVKCIQGRNVYKNAICPDNNTRIHF